jgi:cytochrome P450
MSGDMSTVAAAPVYAPDIYSREAILAPYEHYRAMRDLGPVVWLPEHSVHALPRYAESKAVLLDPDTFISGEGVALNDLVNEKSHGTTLASDGAEHARRRSLVGHRLTPRALRAMREDIEARAERIVEEAVGRRDIDGIVDIALALPMSVVPDFVGWPTEGRENLLAMGAAAFDLLGPMNDLAAASFEAFLGMQAYAQQIVETRDVLPGSMGADLMQAIEDGSVTAEECPSLLTAYLAPALDTTISGLGNALNLFATHPEQWELLKNDRSLLPNAINETLRIESPLRAFSRVAAKDTELSGVPIAAGGRVLVMYASANRDEREWENPERFDVRREASRQISFGHGVHGCAGQGLARLEMQSILSALLDRVEAIVPTGEPTWAVNNIIRRIERLPLELRS